MVFPVDKMWKNEFSTFIWLDVVLVCLTYHVMINSMI